MLSLVLWYVAILCYCRYTRLQVLQGNRDIFAPVTCQKYVLMARGQSPRDSGATNSAVHFHRGWLSNPLIHFQTHAKLCLWAAQRPVSDCTAAFMASRGGFIRSNRNIKSAGTQPRLMNVIWRKDQRETYALILNFVPQTFSFMKEKKKKMSVFKVRSVSPGYLLVT